jgi:hypothetical protein
MDVACSCCSGAYIVNRKMWQDFFKNRLCERVREITEKPRKRGLRKLIRIFGSRLLYRQRCRAGLTETRILIDLLYVPVASTCTGRKGDMKKGRRDARWLRSHYTCLARGPHMRHLRKIVNARALSSEQHARD